VCLFVCVCLRLCRYLPHVYLEVLIHIVNSGWVQWRKSALLLNCSAVCVTLACRSLVYACVYYMFIICVCLYYSIYVCVYTCLFTAHLVLSICVCIYYRYVHVFITNLVFSIYALTISFSIDLCMYIYASTFHVSVYCISGFGYICVFIIDTSTYLLRIWFLVRMYLLHFLV